jgi:hypothetical protein
LAHGFFEEVIARLPEKGIGEAVRVAVAAKFATMRAGPKMTERVAARPKVQGQMEEEALDVRTLQGLAN